MKDTLKVFAAGFAPYGLVLAIFVAFAYLAPCGCMGGCSPQNTPNRCQQTGGAP